MSRSRVWWKNKKELWNTTKQKCLFGYLYTLVITIKGFTYIHKSIYVYIYIYMYILSILVIIYITNWHITNIVIYTSYIYIYIYIHRHMFCPSQDLSVCLGLTSREELMSPECSRDKVLSFAKMLYAKIYNYIYI